MTRAEAQKAIDEAFADGLKRMFAVLVNGLEEGEPTRAMKNFTNGLAIHDDAHSKASAAIDKIFPE